MVNSTFTAPLKDAITEATRTALVTHSKKSRYTPVPELTALKHLLIRPKTVAQTLHVGTHAAHLYMEGEAPTPKKHIPKLREMLRHAIILGRQACLDAENEIFLWGVNPFPQSAIDWYRGRLADAEKVLGKEQSQ